MEVDSPLYCCNPLTVVRGKKPRLVIDLSRSVDKNLHSCKFKYEGLPTLSEMFEKVFWFVTFDLESGYHHIDIDPQFWQLLGFFRSLSIFTTRDGGATLRLGGGGGGTISDSILGRHKTLVLTNSL